MRIVLIDLILLEVVIFIGVVLIPFITDLYKQFLPTDSFEEDEYEEEVFAPISEDIYDEGFVNEQNDYESRISDMKEILKVYKDPSVEIITDEYEKSIER